LFRGHPTSKHVPLFVVGTCRAYPLDVIKRGDVINLVSNKIDPIGAASLPPDRVVDSVLVNPLCLAGENVRGRGDAPELDPIALDLIADFLLLLVLLDDVLGELGVEWIVSVRRLLGTVRDDS
jgi:hypothetical protein